jgi:uncharacterized protein YfaT (DUF1175 family)
MTDCPFQDDRFFLSRIRNQIVKKFWRVHIFAVFIAICVFGLFCLSCSQTEISARSKKSVGIFSDSIYWADSDSDGIPDPIELRTASDRENFREWFTTIAETQFYKASDEWNIEQRDCAGLVRFAMREALRRHDRVWFSRMGAEYSAVASDVKTFTLEKSPVGEKLFRTTDGSFNLDDLADGKLSEFADARTLKSYNATFIGRDRAQAKGGDLLFFNQQFAQKFPYHVMIFLGKSRLVADDSGDWVVYHTGDSPNEHGQVKKVRLSVLDQHPDKKWRPLKNNENFLGFYRLKILD